MLINTPLKPIFLYSVISRNVSWNNKNMMFDGVISYLETDKFPYQPPKFFLNFAFIIGLQPSELFIQIYSHERDNSFMKYTHLINAVKNPNVFRVIVNSQALQFPKIEHPTHYEIVYFLDNKEIFRQPFWVSLIESTHC